MYACKPVMPVYVAVADACLALLLYVMLCTAYDRCCTTSQNESAAVPQIQVSPRTPSGEHESGQAIAAGLSQVVAVSFLASVSCRLSHNQHHSIISNSRAGAVMVIAHGMYTFMKYKTAACLRDVQGSSSSRTQ